MKKYLLASVAGLLLATATNTAQAGEDASWYVSMMAGLSSVQDRMVDEKQRPVEVLKGGKRDRYVDGSYEPKDSTILYKDSRLSRLDIGKSKHFSVAVGRKITDVVRADLQFSYRSGEADASTRFGYDRQLAKDSDNFEILKSIVKYDREVAISAISLVGYYDFWTKDDLSTYFLAGAGAGVINETSSRQFDIKGWGNTSRIFDNKTVSESSHEFITQVGIGTSYAISDSVSLLVEYRHLAVGDFSFDEVNLGLSYNF